MGRELKLDFGCGAHKKPGHLGIDMATYAKPDILADISKPIPGLEDGCAVEIYCHHVLEHIPGDNWHLVMMEMARLLRSGGTYEIYVPHPAHDCAMVQGHYHVLTPHWWECCRDDNWLRGHLTIDRIVELPDQQAVEDGMFTGPDAPPEKLRRYLRNIYFDTLVAGHKP